MENHLKLIIGCDLAAYDFKCQVLQKLSEKKYNIVDIGCYSSEQGDYPPIAEEVALRVVNGEFDRGLLICGTGQGMAIAANKIKGVRAALCYDILPAILSREHNNANILASGSWMITVDKYIQMLEIWLFGKYSGGKHDARLEYINNMK